MLFNQSIKIYIAPLQDPYSEVISIILVQLSIWRI